MILHKRFLWLFYLFFKLVSRSCNILSFRPFFQYALHFGNVTSNVSGYSDNLCNHMTDLKRRGLQRKLLREGCYHRTAVHANNVPEKMCSVLGESRSCVLHCLVTRSILIQYAVLIFLAAENSVYFPQRKCVFRTLNVRIVSHPYIRNVHIFFSSHKQMAWILIGKKTSNSTFEAWKSSTITKPTPSISFSL